jgi:transposase InsO family protein
MREDNLLAIQRRKFVITTDSEHDLEVYVNLGRRMKLTGANQLWIADLTYIRLKHEFVYLSVILDAWSRRVIGWALDRSLASRLAITALERAIDERQPPPGVVHHSDQGVQYDCHDYVSILKTRKMTPSMSRPANPYDNATCESFMRTLKREEIHCREYRDLEDLDSHLANFWIALQSRTIALGARLPDASRVRAADPGEGGPRRLRRRKDEFFQASEIYRPDVEGRNRWGIRPLSPTASYR